MVKMGNVMFVVIFFINAALKDSFRIPRNSMNPNKNKKMQKTFF